MQYKLKILNHIFRGIFYCTLLQLFLLFIATNSLAAVPEAYIVLRYDESLGRVQYSISSDRAKSLLLNGYCHELNGVGRGKIINDYFGWSQQLIPYTIYANSNCSNSTAPEIIDEGNFECPATMNKECKRNSNWGSTSNATLAPKTKCTNKDPSWLVGKQACSCGDKQVSTPINQECPAPILPDKEICDSTKSSWYSLNGSCYCGEKVESSPQGFIQFAPRGSSCASLEGKTLTVDAVCSKSDPSWDTSFMGCRCPAGMVRTTPEKQKCPPPVLPSDAVCDKSQPSFYETRVCNCGFGEPDAMYGSPCKQTLSFRNKLSPGKKCSSADPSWKEQEQSCNCDESYSATPQGQTCPAPELPKGVLCDEKQPSWYALQKKCNCPISVQNASKGEKCEDMTTECTAISSNYNKKENACECGSGIPMVPIGSYCGDAGKAVLLPGRVCSEKDPSWSANNKTSPYYTSGACSCGIASQIPVGIGETCPKKTLKSNTPCSSSDPSWSSDAQVCYCGEKMPSAEDGKRCGEDGGGFLTDGSVCTKESPSWSEKLQNCACKNQQFGYTNLNNKCPSPILKQGVLCKSSEPSYYVSFGGCFCGNTVSDPNATAGSDVFASLNKDCPTAIINPLEQTSLLPEGVVCDKSQASWNNASEGCSCSQLLETPSGQKCPPHLLAKGIACSAKESSWFQGSRVCLCGNEDQGNGTFAVSYVSEGDQCDPNTNYVLTNRFNQTTLTKGAKCEEGDTSWDVVNGWCNCGDGISGTPVGQLCPSPILLKDKKCDSTDPSWYSTISKCNCGNGKAKAEKDAVCQEVGGGDGTQTILKEGTECKEKDASFNATTGSCTCAINKPSTPVKQTCPAPVLEKGKLCVSSDPSWYPKTSTCNCGEGLVVAESNKSCSTAAPLKVLGRDATCSVSDTSYDGATGLCHCGKDEIATPDGQKCPGKALAQGAVCSSSDASWNSKTDTCFCGGDFSSVGSGQKCISGGLQGGDVLASGADCNESQGSYSASSKDCNCGAGLPRALKGKQCSAR